MFCGEPYEDNYKVKLSGSLEFKNGTSTSNTNIKIAITHGSGEYFVNGMTDGTGSFDEEIEIPSSFYNKNFYIKIYTF